MPVWPLVGSGSRYDSINALMLGGNHSEQFRYDIVTLYTELLGRKEEVCMGTLKLP